MKTHLVQELSAAKRQTISQALAVMPTGVFILTSEYEKSRVGHTVYGVHMVCSDPPTVCVSIPKGTPIMADISESHKFGIVVVPEGDPHGLARKFAKGGKGGEEPEDMFLGMQMVQEHPVPVPAHGLSWVVCELMMHLDSEGNDDLFMGRVLDGACVDASGKTRPKVRVAVDAATAQTASAAKK
jgi:flavin reductase (DIM6/NTAB) family NADH-FMN oxidoreductase RutF